MRIRISVLASPVADPPGTSGMDADHAASRHGRHAKDALLVATVRCPMDQNESTYVREHVIPRIAAVSILGWNWLADSVGSLFSPPPRSKLENRDVRQEPTTTNGPECRPHGTRVESTLEQFVAPRKSVSNEGAVKKNNNNTAIVIAGMLLVAVIVFFKMKADYEVDYEPPEPEFWNNVHRAVRDAEFQSDLDARSRRFERSLK